MQILRVPSSPVTYVVSGLNANTAYDYSILDLADRSVSVGIITTDLSGKASIELPSNIDGEYEVSIAGAVESVSVFRPYTDPSALGTIASEVQEYRVLEMVARSIIDSKIQDGFYNKKIAMQWTGNGADICPIWKNVNKVLKVYENNVLIYDSESENNTVEFAVTLDKTGIYKVPVGEYNSLESANLEIPTAYGDLAGVGYRLSSFPKTWDYTFILDIGPKEMPEDIEYATKVLIEDIKCGKLDYYQRYVTSYNTDQFRIQFDKSMINGTGNLIVDTILQNYQKNIKTIGIL